MTAQEAVLQGAGAVPLATAMAAGPGERTGTCGNAGGNPGEHLIEHNLPSKDICMRKSSTASLARFWSLLPGVLRSLLLVVSLSQYFPRLLPGLPQASVWCQPGSGRSLLSATTLASDEHAARQRLPTTRQVAPAAASQQVTQPLLETRLSTSKTFILGTSSIAGKDMHARAHARSAAQF